LHIAPSSLEVPTGIQIIEKPKFTKYVSEVGLLWVAEAFCQQSLEEKKKSAKRPTQSVADNTPEDVAVSSSNKMIQLGSTLAQRISQKWRGQSKLDE
jgi:hypothetical protein